MVELLYPGSLDALKSSLIVQTHLVGAMTIIREREASAKLQKFLCHGQHAIFIS